MKKPIAIGELIELVACGIAARPQDAPMPAALVPHILGMTRAGATLKISFAAEAVADVDAFAAAERICCSGLGFDVQRAPLVLTITASPVQLDGIEQLFRQT